MDSSKPSAADLEAAFKAADQLIRTGNDPNIKITNEDKLKFYALFKYSTSGECKGPAPSRLKIVEKYKYDAWKALGNKMTKDEAKLQYIKEIQKKASYFQPKL